LFTIVIFIIIVILDQGGSVWDIAANVLEVSIIQGVCEDNVVGDTLDGFLGGSNSVEDVCNLVANNLESIVFLEVFILSKEPVSITQLD
jgi:hypothetical protein